MYSALFSIYSSVRLGFLHILQPKPEAATVKAVGLRTQLCPVKTGITEMCTGGTFKSEGAAGKRASIQATESGQVVRREPVGPAGWTAEGKGRSRSRGAWGKQRGSLLRGPESGDIHGRRPRNRPAGNRHPQGTGTQTRTGIPEGDRHPGGGQAPSKGPAGSGGGVGGNADLGRANAGALSKAQAFGTAFSLSSEMYNDTVSRGKGRRLSTNQPETPKERAVRAEPSVRRGMRCD